MENKLKVPRHIGIIPDGNRRWAKLHGLQPETSVYLLIIKTLTQAMLDLRDIGFKEITIYGCSTDNMRRPPAEREAFLQMIIEMCDIGVDQGFNLAIIGDAEDPLFPEVLRSKLNVITSPDAVQLNFLVNYGWDWDINTAIKNAKKADSRNIPVIELLGSSKVSPIDIVARWGGSSRLSGFLPVQTVYSEIYITNEYWPDYKKEHAIEAVRWYNKQQIKHGL